MKKILILLIPLVALGGGIAGGAILRPAPVPPKTSEHEEETSGTADKHEAASSDHGASAGHGGAEASGPAWFTFPAPFFVPLMRNGDMGAMIILTLSLETQAAQIETMNKQQHRLRDALLRELMIHANTGGFDGNFTTEPALRVLRERLLKAVRGATDLQIDQVLIEGIARQAG